jgi:2-polyprenyl-3-methyl-5-hydroxy-6-metoxy-1,4-benzoquinol methylase
MYLTKQQIESFVKKIGQPKASVLLNNFFNSYREHLNSNDVKELYDDEYLNTIRRTPTYLIVDNRYKIHVYNRYSYEYLLSRQKGNSVLEIGCGDGDFLLALAFRGLKCVGIDFSETLIREAEKKASSNNLKAKFLCMDVNDLPEKYRFDYVVMNDVFEHLSDRELDRIFIKIKQLLQPDGEIIIHTPNGLALCNDTDHSFFQCLYKYYLRIGRGFKGFERAVNQIHYDQMHINIKSYRRLNQFLLQYGFKSRIIYDEHKNSLFRSILSTNMLVIARRL